jgi:DNA-binding transcriptional regulator YdaS (Cro superfamily)
MTIRKILEKIFTDRNIDRVKLADMLEIHYSTVTLWMNGKRAPSPIQCLILASLTSGKEKAALQQMAQLSDALILRIIEGLGVEGGTIIQPEGKAFLEWFNDPPEDFDRCIRDYIMLRVKEKRKGPNGP